MPRVIDSTHSLVKTPVRLPCLARFLSLPECKVNRAPYVSMLAPDGHIPCVLACKASRLYENARRRVQNTLIFSKLPTTIIVPVVFLRSSSPLVSQLPSGYVLCSCAQRLLRARCTFICTLFSCPPGVSRPGLIDLTAGPHQEPVRFSSGCAFAPHPQLANKTSSAL